MKRLKEDVLKEMEYRILSETYGEGERLPAERELAEEFAVSRPVVHEALLILEAKGLITMRPRHGAVVNDVRKQGTIELLSSLLCHRENDAMSREVLSSLYRVRALMESDAARLACRASSDEDREELAALIASEEEQTDPAGLAMRDFLIHLAVARMSGNIIYPLLINSLKPVYLQFLETFYGSKGNKEEIRSLQNQLLEALSKGEEVKAAALMKVLSSFTLE